VRRLGHEIRPAILGAFAVLATMAQGCDAPSCDVSTCDIRHAACQQQVAHAVTCVRGGKERVVPVKVVEADKYIAEQAKQADDADDAEHVRLWYRGLSALLLTSEDLEPGTGTQASLERVAAFYSAEDKRVTVLDRGDELDSYGSVLLLAHEYVHALQDAEYDLTQLDSEHAQTTDSALGVNAIIEGEAVLYTDQLQSMALGFDLNEVDWQAAFSQYRSSSRTRLAVDDNPYLQLQSAFVYGYGASYVYAAWTAGGNDAVRVLHRTPPASARQVIVGYGEPPPGGKPWIERELDDVAIPWVQRDGYELVNWEHLGSYAFYAYLLKHRALDSGAEPGANAVIAQLRSDVVSVQASDGPTIVTGWRLRFANVEAAESALELLRPDPADGIPSEHMATIGRDLSIVAPTTRDGFDPFLELPPTSWGPIPDADAGVMPDAGSPPGAMIP
jgi:hypothetical protein